MILKMLSAEVVCCRYLLTVLSRWSTDVNSVDPDQTAPIGAVWTGFKLFEQVASKTFR